MKNALLLPTTCHRPTVTKASVYSLTLRIRRIYSVNKETEEQFKILAKKLRKRNYSEKVIEDRINRARKAKREDILKRVEKKKGGEEGRQHILIIKSDRRRGPAKGKI